MATSPRYCLKRPKLSDRKEIIKEDLETKIDEKLSKRWLPGDEINIDLDVSSLEDMEIRSIFDYFRIKYSLFLWEGVVYLGPKDNIVTFRLIFPDPLKG